MSPMKIALPLTVALVLGATPLLAGSERYSDQPEYVAHEGAPPPGARGGLYDRIVARYGHLGRDVKEEFQDGPCRIERRWYRDGDFSERIKCRGPRD
jgi:hypothetical protein